ncbi:acyltransferase family protein [Streptomyces sp. NPDC017082]|uniref:acyltransferase family protein n=1 Tax=Streptomyces sp. NPDC017082 TaxID=3364974 RepID=UPI00379D79CB
MSITAVLETHPSKTPAARLPSLTGIRFIAAALVFVFHAQWEVGFIGGEAGKSISAVLDRSGTWGVGLFFLLSGFVLAWTARLGDTTRAFWRRRTVKIYPTHLVTMLAALALAVSAGELVSTSQWLPNLFLVQSWWPDAATVVSLNGVAWSLSCEFFFYLAFPFLLRALNRIRDARLWPAVAVVAAAVLAATLAAQVLISDQPRLPTAADGSLSYAQIWFVWFFPPVRALEFVLGILLARIVRSGQWPPIGCRAAVAIAVGGYVVSLYVPYLFGVGGAATLLTAPLVASAALADTRGQRTSLDGTWMVRLGEWSFALYMVHRIVIIEIRKAVGAAQEWPFLVGFSLILFSFVVSLVLAALIFTYVETPLVRRFSRPRDQRPPRVRTRPAGEIPEAVGG